MLVPEVPPDLGFLSSIRQCNLIDTVDWPEWVNHDILLYNYFQHGRHINGILELLETLNTDANFRGIVLHNDVEPVLRAVAQWGLGKGLPVIHIPHSHYFEVWRDEKGWDIHDVVTATHIAAINKVQAKWYQSRGAKHVKVCGKPEWDQWSKWSVPTAKARKLLGLELDQPTVCYMSSWPQSTSLLGEIGDFPYAAFGELCGAVKGLGWNLILKVHPSGSTDINKTHRDIIKKVGVSGVATSEHLGLTIQAADVVTSFGPSNGLIEASIVGKPTICIGADVSPLTCVPANADAISGMLMSMRGQEENSGVRGLAAHVGEATQKVADYVSEVCLAGPKD